MLKLNMIINSCNGWIICNSWQYIWPFLITKCSQQDWSFQNKDDDDSRLVIWRVENVNKNFACLEYSALQEKYFHTAVLRQQRPTRRRQRIYAQLDSVLWRDHLFIDHWLAVFMTNSDISIALDCKLFEYAIAHKYQIEQREFEQQRKSPMGRSKVHVELTNCSLHSESNCAFTFRITTIVCQMYD